MSQLLLGGSGNMMQRVALLECIPLALERYWSNAKMHAPCSVRTKRVETDKCNNDNSNTNFTCWNEERATFAIDAAVGAVILGGAESVLVPASLVAFVEAHRRNSFHSPPLRLSSSEPSEELLPIKSGIKKNNSSNSENGLSVAKEKHVDSEMGKQKHYYNHQETKEKMESETKLSIREWDILRNEQCFVVLLDIHQGSNHENNMNKKYYNYDNAKKDSGDWEPNAATSHTAFWEFVSQYKQMYTKFCVPVPASPLASKLFFNNIPLDTFEAHYLAQFKEEIAQAGSCYAWQAWMRSALSCSYEGNYLPPIRLAEQTAMLLTNSYNVHRLHETNNNKSDNRTYTNDGFSSGCSGVIWESATGNGLTPRWLETSVKAAASCGVPVHALTLALADDGNVSNDDKVNNTQSSTVSNNDSIVPLIYKGLEMGITRYATCTLPDICTFDKTQTLPALDTVTQLINGYYAFHATNDYYQVANEKSNYSRKKSDSDNVVSAVGNSQEYAEAVHDT